MTGATNVIAECAGGLLFKNVTETEVLIAITAGGVAPAPSSLYLTGFIDN